MEQLFLENLPLIEKLASLISRRHHASVEEAEDFSSELKLKLLENDYAVLRKFKGDSLLGTYLTTVVTRAFLDFRIQRWGRWRPSAAAEALGPVAIRLEELVYKDGWSFDQACEILRINYRVKASRRELEEIWKRLPPRTPRRMEGEDPLQDLPAPEERPEEKILEEDLRKTRDRVNAALRRVLQQLPSEDRLLIRLGVLEEIKIVNVARSLDLEQKPLYRRLERILKGLRSDLEREGVRWVQVADLLNRSDLGWGFSGRRPKRTEDLGPSI
jgi:RNA polymerase sigma factor for flagellar operon FliA